ncbi:MAG: L-2-hydroxyglutarate oxidase [Candidatus Omnitrophota bacterium]|jgi:L-2-hydroxyglutarate oxidase LhgO
MKNYDYVIVGGGIIGTSIARALAVKKKGAKIALFEKEPRLGMHASGRNSGVIHSGINQKSGTLKARFCLEGSRLLREYCRMHQVPMVECGTLVVGRNERERGILETLLELGRACSVPGITLLSGEELRRREPRAAGEAALLSPTGATVDSMALLEAVAEEGGSWGVDFRFSSQVLHAEPGRVQTASESFGAAHVINCAGLYADKIAHQMGAGAGYSIIPFRGEYMEVKHCPVNTMIYQPPDLRFPFLSIHLTRETDGRVLAGPSAILAFGREAYDKQWVLPELAEIVTNLALWKLMTRPDFLKLCADNFLISVSRRHFFSQIKGLLADPAGVEIVPARSGIRAQMIDRQGNLVNDLLVEKGEKSTHVLNAVSPGMTCALAFADYVIDEYVP